MRGGGLVRGGGRWADERGEGVVICCNGMCIDVVIVFSLFFLLFFFFLFFSLLCRTSRR